MPFKKIDIKKLVEEKDSNLASMIHIKKLRKNMNMFEA